MARPTVVGRETELQLVSVRRIQVATIIELGATARRLAPLSLIEKGLFRIFGDEPKGNQQIGAVSSIAGHPL
jgi:hypothetical protein